MLLGTHNPRLDEKGRLILPAKFRDEFSTGLVITRGQDRCLYVFSAREFEQLTDKISQAPISSKAARDFLRSLLSGATDEVSDKQGRVTIPAMLRDYAGLDRDLAVIGMGNRAEIWDLKVWNDTQAARDAAFSEIAEEVIPGLF
ncbi:MAG: division/cell wall cluster transcriptional repressor MraZ [Actinomycetales bacterium]|nr:division/cell wall cluster transcriptional repressor MraZ [Actinomycetales bacterium]